MAFQNKFKSLKNLVSDQDGVTLLLGILILASITAISFSLATIAFVEIRSSADVVRSEPALYVIQGQIEEAIFKVKRAVPTGTFNGMDFTSFNANFGDCTTASAIKTINSVKATAKLCPRNLDNVYYASVSYANRDKAASQNSNLTYAVYFPLVDPTQFNNTGDLNTQSYPSSYKRIIFKYASPSNYAQVRIFLCTEYLDVNKACLDVDNTIPTNPPFNPFLTQSGGQALSATTPAYYYNGGCVGITLSSGMACYDLDPTLSYSVYLLYDSYNLSNLANKYAYIQIKTCGVSTSGTDTDCPNGYGPRGLYFPGKQTVDVSADSVGGLLTRKYRVFIPE